MSASPYDFPCTSCKAPVRRKCTSINGAVRRTPHAPRRVAAGSEVEKLAASYRTPNTRDFACTACRAKPKTPCMSLANSRALTSVHAPRRKRTEIARLRIAEKEMAARDE